MGDPKVVRRLSYIVLQRKSPLDNRIKITNGKARIVQKIKSKANNFGKRVNQEFEVDIPDTLEAVKTSISFLENFYKTYEIAALKLIVQHESYIWKNNEYELKIAKQFGKEELFVYEIESFGKKTPEEIQIDLNIKPDYNSFSEERQALRRKRVDIPFQEISEKEIDDLIIKYLNYTA